MSDNDGVVKLSSCVRTSRGEAVVGDSGVGAVTSVEPERIGDALQNGAAHRMFDQRRLSSLTVEVDNAVDVGGDVEGGLALVDPVDKKMECPVPFPDDADAIVCGAG